MKNLLVLAPSYPFPPRDGVQLRLNNLLRRLPSEWRLTLLCTDHVSEVMEETLPAPLEGVGVRLPTAPRPTGFLASPVVQIVRPEASMIWKFRSPAMEAEVARRAPQADGVLAIGLQMAQYLRCVPADKPIALDNYNVESLILDRLADTRTGPKRLYWKNEAGKLRRTERRLLGAARNVWAISEVDRVGMKDLAGSSRLFTVPMGIDLAHFTPPADSEPAVPPRFTFVGAFNWHVNEDAAEWFCGEVWPRVRAELPEAELHLVGRDPSPLVRALGKDPSVKVSGTVPDVRPYLWDSTGIVVPLRYGSGVRTKILEAFAAERPVVSTAVGAEGLPVRDGKELLLAEEAEGLANACLRLAREPRLVASLTGTATTYLREQDRQATEQLHAAFHAAFGV